MTRRFTIKVAGAEWLDNYEVSWLTCPTGTLARVRKISHGNYEASVGDEKKTCNSLAAAKAYVLKQLATTEGKRK